MQAETLIQQGRVADALEALKTDVRSDPARPDLRVFLFQIFCVQGQWGRALNQLNVASDLSKGNNLMAQVCRELLQCEAFRTDVFAGRRSPLVFGEPQEWVGKLVEAQKLYATGDIATAAALRGDAYEDAPALSGRITTGLPPSESGEMPHPPQTHPFEWLADADMRLGPMMEAVIEGRYFWVPMFNIRKIEFEAPSDLRDVVWAPAQFTWINGGDVVAFLPVRYPGSESNPDDLIKLARRTDFTEPDGLCIGHGQRMFATDQDEYPMLLTREIEFDHPSLPEVKSASETGEEGVNGG